MTDAAVPDRIDAPSRRRRTALIAALPLLALIACSDEPSVRLLPGEQGEVSGQPGSGESEGGAGNPGEPSGTPDTVLTELNDEDRAGALPPGSRAGTYTGTVNGRPVTVVVGADDAVLGLLPGLAGRDLLVSGTPASLVAHPHEDGLNDTRATVWPFGGASQAVENPLVVADGRTVSGTIDGVDVTLSADRATLLPATTTRLAGDWQGVATLCDSSGRDCATVQTSIQVRGDTLDGTTDVLSSSGDAVFSAPLQGSFTRLGAAAPLDLVWNSYRYSALMHLVPGDVDRLQIVGVTDATLADHASLAFTLLRQP